MVLIIIKKNINRKDLKDFTLRYIIFSACNDIFKTLRLTLFYDETTCLTLLYGRYIDVAS